MSGNRRKNSQNRSRKSSRSRSRGRSGSRGRSRSNNRNKQHVINRQQGVSFVQDSNPIVARPVFHTNRIRRYRGTAPSSNISGTTSSVTSTLKPNVNIFRTLAASIILWCKKNGFKGDVKGSYVPAFVAIQTVIKNIMTGQTRFPERAPWNIGVFLKAISPKSIIVEGRKTTFAWDVPEDFIWTEATWGQAYFGSYVRPDNIAEWYPFTDFVDYSSGSDLSVDEAYSIVSRMLADIAGDVETVEVARITYTKANAFSCGEGDETFTGLWSRTLYGLFPIDDWIGYLGLAQPPSARLGPRNVITVQAPPQAIFGFMLDQNRLTSSQFSRCQFKYRVVEGSALVNAFVGWVYESYVNSRIDWAQAGVGLESLMGGFIYTLLLLNGQYAHQNHNIRYEGADNQTFTAVVPAVGTVTPTITADNSSFMIPAFLAAAVTGNGRLYDGNNTVFLSGVVLPPNIMGELYNRLIWVSVIDTVAVDNLLNFDPTNSWLSPPSVLAAVLGSGFSAIANQWSTIMTQWSAGSPMANCLSTQPCQTAQFTEIVFKGDFPGVQDRLAAYVKWWKDRLSTSQVLKRRKEGSECEYEYAFGLPVKGRIWVSATDFLALAVEELNPRVWYVIPEGVPVRSYLVYAWDISQKKGILSQFPWDDRSLTLTNAILPSMQYTQKSAGISEDPTRNELDNMISIVKDFMKSGYSVETSESGVVPVFAETTAGQKAVKKPTNDQGTPWWKFLTNWVASATKGIPVLGPIATLGDELAGFAAKRDREIKAKRRMKKNTMNN